MTNRVVPILSYHRVYEDDDCPPPPPMGDYCGHVSLTDFRRHLAALAERNLCTVTNREVTAWLLDGAALPERAVMIDFGDGRLNVYENAFPVMRDYAFTGTVFVVSQLAQGADLGDMSNLYPAMGWDELEVLADAGWGIGAHTRTHPLLAELFKEDNGPERCTREIVDSRKEIEERMHVPADCFAYPGESWSEDVERIVKGAYRTARLWSPQGDPVYNTTRTDPYRLQANNVSAQLQFENFCRILDGAA